MDHGDWVHTWLLCFSHDLAGSHSHYVRHSELGLLQV